MDKIVFLNCIVPELYYELFYQCKTLKYQQAFTSYIEKTKLSHITLNMAAFPMALRNYLQMELMRQEMKVNSYEEAMNVLSDFLWKYFYPLEPLYDSLCKGKQFVFVHVLDNVLDKTYVNKIIDYVVNRLKEHNYINVSSSSLVTLCTENTKNFESMFQEIENLVQTYVNYRINIIDNHAELNDKSNVYANMIGYVSRFNFEEILLKR